MRFPDDYILRLPTPFQIFRLLTGTDHLHFGLFLSAVDEDVHAAQERMVGRLLSFLPDGPLRILDLGTGLGATACTLAEKGHHVTGIAPDPALIDYARALARWRGVTGRTDFQALAFESFPSTADPPFDVVLAQESLQYLRDLKSAFAHMAEILAPRGSVVAGDQVLRNPEGRGAVAFHMADDIVSAAVAAGFELLRRDDVTAMALHTPARALAALAQRRDEIVAFFEPHQPRIQADLEVCLRHGGNEAAWYLDGHLGYELFLFGRMAG